MTTTEEAMKKIMTADLDAVWAKIPTTLRYVIGGKRHVEVKRRSHNSTRRVVVPLTDLTEREIALWAKR